MIPTVRRSGVGTEKILVFRARGTASFPTLPLGGTGRELLPTLYAMDAFGLSVTSLRNEIPATR